MSVASPSSRDVKFHRDALKIVEKHLSEKDFNVTEFYTCLGMSRITLHRKIIKVFHQSAGDFIRERRLLHAAKLLKEGDYNVSDVARLSGFYNPSYFSKCFKERFGVKPSEYH